MIRALEVTNGEACHVPGSYLEGNIKCCFRKNMFVKIMKIRFFGNEFANVKITGDTLFNMDNGVCYTETVLLQNSSVLKGTTSYKFKLQIPLHIPSSYINKYGGIRYMLEGNIMLKNAKINKSSKNIQIFSPVDLQCFNQKLSEKQTFSCQKELVGICGSGGLVSSVIHVDRRIFLCGEPININIAVNNLSGILVNKIKVYLMKSDSCRLDDGEYAIGESIVICKHKCCASVGRNEEKTYQLSIIVPDEVLIPNLKHSKFFKIKHWIRVNIHFIAFWRRPLVFFFKVYLGHIPLEI